MINYFSFIFSIQIRIKSSKKTKKDFNYNRICLTKPSSLLKHRFIFFYQKKKWFYQSNSDEFSHYKFGYVTFFQVLKGFLLFTKTQMANSKDSIFINNKSVNVANIGKKHNKAIVCLPHRKLLFSVIYKNIKFFFLY